MRPILLPLLALTAPALAAAAPAHTLPMWMQGNHPTIAVNLDGRVEPLRFVVDSAAGATLVDDRIARRYKLEDSAGAVSVAQGASARSAQLRRVRASTWQLGSLQLQTTAVQTDLSRLSREDDPAIDGIIGNDLTRRWDTRWDFAAGTLQLWSPATLPGGAHCQANALPDRGPAMKGFGFITVHLGNEKLDAIAVVDTGAAQTVLNAAAASALGIRTDGSDPRVKVREKGTAGLGGQAHPTWLHDLPAMASGPWQHAAMEVRISDLPVFKALGLESRPALILGADAMAGAQVDITTGAERICLQASTDD
ncbi:pepsin/retropepsin-like aspartic protease family protein [Stenotrophomonas sp. NA06056]|uniref:pepsin/retropepsin-like aspartic protease family protein n=1 Tax=Stenotrophomonas sp. NA06056 TaxID=2742129 RepID=UPI0015884AE7|nr:pepsin/retropepsin-like aspartic protease family protein [Stenotrophomonas sp. NA06056]QKW55413.1 aspartyl protease family protein [Stenotrophomonas sp. NA06056]